MLTETPPDRPWTQVSSDPSGHPRHDADRDPPDVPSPRQGTLDSGRESERGTESSASETSLNTESSASETSLNTESSASETSLGTAIELLTGYLAAVADALRVEGFGVTHSRVEPGPLLHARLTLTPVEPSPGRPARITLAWAEDTGWSVTHSRLRATPTPWRYLHSRLIPSPVAVATFVILVLTDTEDLAMLYPAQFRRHTQPLRPVIDALAEHGFVPSERTADPFEQHPENQ
jgi:hypothetical protein